MLKVLKVAAFLSVACVTAASAAPALNGLNGAKSTSDNSVELARGTKCYSHSCTHSRRKASHRGKIAYRPKRHSHSHRHRSRKHVAHARGDSSDAPRGCLTGAARALLGRIESRFGRVSVISTCRPGATIAGSGRPSRHASGNAVDFDAGGRKSQIVSWLIANHKSGGTMTYPTMNHIHVDIGPHFVSLAGHRRYASKSYRRHARGYTHKVARRYSLDKRAMRGLGARQVAHARDDDD